ncbi:8235_t:CDS:2 [Paraglomus occultum]|uniref:8235_t:CDS:1 n=1 Tax=Paraglomus occultum TaxID=144539 RepID=A0A9N9AAE0_9GLOM|nr:8235_t:CDS:2 [Paraglomus occultum]
MADVLERKVNGGHSQLPAAKPIPNAYVELWVDNSRHQRSDFERTLRPKWEKSFLFRLKALPQTLNIAVLDHNKAPGKNTLFTFKMPLNDLGDFDSREESVIDTGGVTVLDFIVVTKTSTI